jgi:diaminopimelate decarboxylase
MHKLESRLARVAAFAGTPAYAYDLDLIRERLDALRALFGRHFGVSFAVKCNPNVGLLKRMLPDVDTFDVSSYAEVERALAAGCPPEHITFSGPAKRPQEVEGAVAQRIGELVLESVEEAEMAEAAAARLKVRQPVLVRINPATSPKQFGVSMAGKPSQFGIDEEEIEAALDQISAMPHLDLVGFHIYSGTNSLSVDAIAANFANFIRIFRHVSAHAGIAPRKLIFGSGFGVPYTDGEAPLDVAALAAEVTPLIDDLKSDSRFAKAVCMLEMGRWIVGPAGWLLTQVIRAKTSRGVDMRMCDAGFNNHLAACGMMGTVIRRNWRYLNVSHPTGPVGEYNLVGPLCTTIDILASNLSLPEPRVGDVLAVCNSGAYGLTSSPTRFISHPEPAEVLIDGDELIDVTESALNHWRTVAARPAAQAAQLVDG